MNKIMKKAAKIVASKKALLLLERFLKKEKSLVIALGSGTTMAIFTHLLGASKLKDKIKIIPSSPKIAKVVRKNKISLIKKGMPSLAVDGADQVTRKGVLKGHGALAFTKEKQLDYCAKKIIFVINKEKLSQELTLPVIVEVKKKYVYKFKKALFAFKCKIIKRAKRGNNIFFFLSFESLKNPRLMEKKLNKLPGAIDNGIFANFKNKPIIITN